MQASHEEIDEFERRRDGGLTPTGVKQAELTAQRLQPLPIDAIHVSTMRRAVETATLIAAAHPTLTTSADRDLWECIPHVPPHYREWTKQYPASLLQREQAQASRAFDRYFQAALGADERHELIVCHGNLIRYFICRALQVTPDAWVNMNTHNGGLSIVQVQPDGECKLIAFNDTGHLPTTLLTFHTVQTES